MLYELSRHLVDCTSVTLKEELDLLMQSDGLNVKSSMDFYLFIFLSFFRKKVYYPQ